MKNSLQGKFKIISTLIRQVLQLLRIKQLRRRVTLQTGRSTPTATIRILDSELTICRVLNIAATSSSNYSSQVIRFYDIQTPLILQRPYNITLRSIYL